MTDEMELGPMGLPYGIHHDVPESLYHAPAFGVASKSALMQVIRSPAHYLHWHNNPGDSDSPALAFGRAFHCAALEPERFAQTYITSPDFGDMRSSKNRASRDEWVENNASVTVISADWMEKIEAMCAAINAHPLVSQMLVGGQSEVTVTWKDRETGLSCKSRADYLVPDKALVVDLKSTLEDAGPESFKRSIVKYKYHMQDALYRDGFTQAGVPIKHFVMVAVEKVAPFGVAVYTLDQEGIAKGYTAARQGMDLLAHAVKTDSWGGYPEHINTIELPPWA